VINIITTKTNITKPVNAKATVTAGSFGTFKTNINSMAKRISSHIRALCQIAAPMVFLQPMTVPV
jgi:hypothetical protein